MNTRNSFKLKLRSVERWRKRTEDELKRGAALRWPDVRRCKDKRGNAGLRKLEDESKDVSLKKKGSFKRLSR